MDWDEAQRPRQAIITIGEPLSGLSIVDLEARIDALRVEIARIEGEAEKKRAHEAAAAKLFKP